MAEGRGGRERSAHGNPLAIMTKAEVVWLFTNLPPRQKLLFKFLFSPLQLKEIGFQMDNAKQTITQQCVYIYKKFGVENRIGLILLVTADSETLKTLTSLQIMR